MDSDFESVVERESQRGQLKVSNCWRSAYSTKAGARVMPGFWPWVFPGDQEFTQPESQPGALWFPHLSKNPRWPTLSFLHGLLSLDLLRAGDNLARDRNWG